MGGPGNQEKLNMTQFHTATFRDGKFVPDEPIQIPEGQKAFFALPSDSNATDPSDFRPEEIGWDDPAEVAAKIARMQAVEPLEMSDEEIRDWEAYRERVKQYTLEKMRTQTDFNP